MNDGGKAIYEALQAVNAKLDEEGEQLLVGLVELIREGLRGDAASPVIYLDGAGPTDTALRRWIEVDAAEPQPDQPLQCVGCFTGRGAHSTEPGVCTAQAG